MATARTFIHAAPEDIFNVLSNPETYEYWVVGCQQIHDADEAFPEPGSSFEHRIGVGPLEIQDITTVVELRIQGRASGTEVEMRQQPAAGPIAKLDNPLQQLFTSVRDRECLRRLRRLAER